MDFTLFQQKLSYEDHKSFSVSLKVCLLDFQRQFLSQVYQREDAVVGGRAGSAETHT